MISFSPSKIYIFTVNFVVKGREATSYNDPLKHTPFFLKKMGRYGHPEKMSKKSALLTLVT